MTNVDRTHPDNVELRADDLRETTTMDTEKKWPFRGLIIILGVVLAWASLLIGPKLAIDAYFSWTWKAKLAAIRAPYEFENRETMMKLCTTFLEWEARYGDDTPIGNMAVICVPEIPPKEPISVKRQNRLPAAE